MRTGSIGFSTGCKSAWHVVTRPVPGCRRGTRGRRTDARWLAATVALVVVRAGVKPVVSTESAQRVQAAEAADFVIRVAALQHIAGQAPSVAGNSGPFGTSMVLKSSA